MCTIRETSLKQNFLVLPLVTLLHLYLKRSIRHSAFAFCLALSSLTGKTKMYHFNFFQKSKAGRFATSNYYNSTQVIIYCGRDVRLHICYTTHTNSSNKCTIYYFEGTNCVGVHFKKREFIKKKSSWFRGLFSADSAAVCLVS